MSEVKRYDAGCNYAGDDEMVQNKYGAYVTYDDYAALQQKLDAVLAENARMLSDYRDIPEMRRIGAPLTPATDAILNEVRADAIETFAMDLAHRINRSEYSQYYEDEAINFAAQLRAGSNEGGV